MAQSPPAKINIASDEDLTNDESLENLGKYLIFLFSFVTVQKKKKFLLFFKQNKTPPEYPRFGHIKNN